MSRKNKKVRMSSRIDLADALRKESSLSAFTFDGPYRLTAYSALFDHGLASKSDQRFAYIRSTGNLTFSIAF
ncbi:hypothetical protein [Escherichia coli]|uniref:hypothetical protein n=1 Tax=Escherichia coli TaxID=562 RepID=UPI000B8BD96B|nr:hypothetical protein [Escherichia coli]